MNYVLLILEACHPILVTPVNNRAIRYLSWSPVSIQNSKCEEVHKRIREELRGIVAALALCTVAASAFHDNNDNYLTNLGLRSNLHGSSSGGSYTNSTRCLLKLHQVSNLQGSALQYWNSKLLKLHKYGLAKVKKRFNVKSLETIGPCCWKICKTRRGRCKGRIVPGKTQVHNLSEIKISRVKRIKAMKEKKCARWSENRNSKRSQKTRP